MTADWLAKAIRNDLLARMYSGQDLATAEQALARWILIRRGNEADLEEELRYVLARKKSDELGAGPVLVDLATVTPEPVTWVCEGWLARGKLNLLSGDPKLGKSFISLSYAAAVSHGRPWPNKNGVATRQGSVIVLSGEDDIADTIVQRLKALGADLDRIKALKSVRSPRAKDGTIEERQVALDTDLVHIEAAVRELGDVALVIIDPIMSFMGDTEIYNAAEVRSVLTPLAILAARHKIAVLAINHLNKGKHGPAIYRSSGSLAFAAVARMLLTVAKDKLNPTRRLLLRDGNLIRAGSGGLAYSIAEDESGQPVPTWEIDPVRMSADEALSGSDEEDDDHSVLERARQFLREALASGSVPSTELQAAAKQNGISTRTLRRGEADLGVESKKIGGRWFKVLPPSPKQDGQPGEPSSLDPLATLGGNGHLPSTSSSSLSKEGMKEGGQGVQGGQGEQGGRVDTFAANGTGEATNAASPSLRISSFQDPPPEVARRAEEVAAQARQEPLFPTEPPSVHDDGTEEGTDG